MRTNNPKTATLDHDALGGPTLVVIIAGVDVTTAGVDVTFVLLELPYGEVTVPPVVVVAMLGSELPVVDMPAALVVDVPAVLVADVAVVLDGMPLIRVGNW